MPAQKETVWVLHWECDDKSGHGIEAIYRNEEDANRDYDLITKYDSNRKWGVDSYPIK